MHNRQPLQRTTLKGCFIAIALACCNCKKVLKLFMESSIKNKRYNRNVTARETGKATPIAIDVSYALPMSPEENT